MSEPGPAPLEAVMARLSASPGPSPRGKRRAARRFIIIGSVVLTAAAGALTWLWDRSLQPLSADSTDLVASPAATSADPALTSAAPGPVAEISAPVQEREASQAVPADVKLPLVLPPKAAPADAEKSSLVLQKALEQHPELAQGPPLDWTSTFFVALVMRTDGAVLDSAAELATRATVNEVSNRVPGILPGDVGEYFATSFPKGWQLPNGSALRAHVRVEAVLVSGNADVTRTDARVRQILGHTYDELMTPIDSDEGNLLTIFLSEDGSILREKVERVTRENSAVVRGIGTGLRDEEAIAVKLGIGMEQIGLVGRTVLEQGTPEMIVDESGLRRVVGVSWLDVRYAWARQADEAAAFDSPPDPIEPQAADFDITAALAVVERLFPEAFSHAPPSTADMQTRPAVVFTAEGEVLRSGRIEMRNAVEFDSLLQQQLVPGVRTQWHRSVRLTNEAGATAMVVFAWVE